jgi:SRSO17 transposase
MTTAPRLDEQLARLESYLCAYRGAFRRQDQLRWAAAYLLGLLQPGERKSIENLARSLPASAHQGMRDPAQALQHFIHQSPWNEDRVRQVYLAQAAPLASPAGIFAVEELTFVKQGRHSVGVQRQYSSSLGRKVNCQVAIALHHVGPEGCVPLGLRLYLPRGWLQDAARLKAAGVPDSFHTQASKAAIALSLLDDARQAGISASGVALGASAGLGEELREGLPSRGLSYLGLAGAELRETLRENARLLQEELGLDHFEGRSWRGFHHHACLVLLAHGYRVFDVSAETQSRHAVSSTWRDSRPRR